MGLIAKYEITCPGLPLVEVAATIPDATLELEFHPSDDWYAAFVVQVVDGPTQAVEDAFNQVTFVKEYTRFRSADRTPRYRIEPALGMQAQLGNYVDNISDLQALALIDSTIETIRITPTGWIQTGWFANREALDELWSFWQRNGEFTLHRLTPDHEPSEPSAGLTDRQREALLTAYEMGYFDIPRNTNLTEVATALGISAPSLSERLRRAQIQVIESLIDSEELINGLND